MATRDYAMCHSIRFAMIPGLVLALQAAAVLAETAPPNPSLLSSLRDSVCFAESFEDGRSGTQIEGISGKAVQSTEGMAAPSFPDDVLPHSACTVSWWAKCSQVPDKTVRVFSLDGDSCLYINFFGLHGSDDYRHSNRVGHFFYAPAGANFAYYPNGITPGTWHHFALTWSADRLSFYMDGYPSSSNLSKEPVSKMFATKSKGRFSIGGGGIGCAFDELRIYNRELSQNEIKGYIAAVRAGGESKDLALAVPATLAPRNTFGIRSVYRMSDRCALVYADLSGLPGDDDRLVRVTVRNGAGITACRPVMEKFKPGILAVIRVPFAEPPPSGEYRVDVTATCATGRMAGTTTFTRVKEIWEDNKIGVTDGNVAPCTPMSASGSEVSCWGRTYTFGALGLPSQIDCTQPEPTRGPATQPLLASPIDLVVHTSDGKLEWHNGPTLIHQHGSGYVDVHGSASTKGGKFNAELSGCLDFDGFYKFRLKLTPSEAISVDSIFLDVALSDSLALLFNMSGSNAGMRSDKAFLDLSGKQDGELWNSFNDGKNKPYNFAPYVWIGDDDRGLAFMADSERGWVVDYSKPCMDLVRENGVTHLRLHLVNAPTTLTKPIDTTLSFQATPIKPRAAGESWKKASWYGWAQFDQPDLWDGCFDAYAKGMGDKWFLTDEARKENHWWRYFSLDSPRIQPASSYGPMLQRYADEWGASGQPPSEQDFRLWAFKQWHNMPGAGMSGIYFDNTFPTYGALGSMLTWADASGARHQGFNMFENREFMKRVRTYFLQQGPAPVMQAHMTDAPVVGYLGFADFWLDGENGGYPPDGMKDPDFIDRWYNCTGMANLRINLGRQWGVMPRYLYSWKPDPTQAVLGLFDIDHNYFVLNGLDYHFGNDEADCRFLPYWDMNLPVKIVAGGPDVLCSAWRRAGRLRVQVSNMSDIERNVSATVDMAKLGLSESCLATDEQTGDPVSFDNGCLKELRISPHNYRIVLIGAPGDFPRVPALDPSLLPHERIADLCDALSAVGPAWQRLGGDLSCRNQMICFPSPAYSMLARPFHQDNCSVIVKIRSSRAYWDAPPSLILYWNKDAFVGMSAGGTHPLPDGRKVQAWWMGGGKTQRLAPGNVAGTITWLKITLRPGDIFCEYTTDGKSWLALGTIPRHGLTGAPRYLEIGHGPVSDPEATLGGNDRSQDANSFFTDLVVGKN